MSRYWSRFVFVSLSAVVLAGPALAQAAPAPDANVYAAAGQTVFSLFAFALVLESALAVVFNWRPFIEVFNPRAVRPLVAFLVALILVTSFQLDLTTSLANAVGNQSRAPGPLGLILTALIIAGGSAGVNVVLIGLGFREVKTIETAPKPPPTKAWIAVRARRVRASKGDIAVFVGKAAAGGTPPRVGTISGRSANGLARFFLVDRGRYPSYGGYEIDPAGGPYNVVLRDPSGAIVANWGPEDVAAGGIIDVTLDV